MYWKLNQTQRKAIAHIVQGRTVTDLGAGDLSLAKELLKLGAAKVVAIDKQPGKSPDPRIEVRKGYYKDLQPQPSEVAVLAWPSNSHLPGLEEFLRQASVVVYLGKNTNGTACGTPELFKYFLTRKLSAHLPDRLNTMLVYKGSCAPRAPVGEEVAGIDTFVMWDHDELYPTTASSKGSRAPYLRSPR